MDQRSLATKVGVSRQWLVGVEAGKSGAALGLVLRTLNALGMRLRAETSTDGARDAITIPEAAVNINAIVEKARRRKT
jgi:HTH-type transcriptional regulator / antitoxin HipB